MEKSKIAEAKETALFRALYKALNNNEDHAFFYFFGITAHPPNTWITPTNKDSQDYFIFNVAFNEANAVICKRSPVWQNGSFKGHRIEFRYNLNLDY